MGNKVKISVGHIRKLVRNGRVEFNSHALDRATERAVTIDQAIRTILGGELVGKNEDIIPYPTAEFECVIDDKTLFVALTQSKNYILIRTVYWK